MVMFLLSFVKGVQIRGGESISARGYGPGGSISASGFGPGGPILGGSKSAGTMRTQKFKSRLHNYVFSLLSIIITITSNEP